MTIVTRSDITQAIEKCCAQNPSEGVGCKLHPDASKLADVFGKMLHYKRETEDLSSYSLDTQEAVMRWVRAIQ